MQHLRVERSLDFPLPADQTVDIDDWKIGEYLHTLGACCCIVFAASNLTTRQGLLGHFNIISPGTKSHRYSSHDTFNMAIDYLPELGNPQDTTLWLGGGTPVIVGDTDITNPHRQYAINRASSFVVYHSLPESALRVGWNPPHTCVDVLLDSEHDLLIVGEYPQSSPGRGL